jgi:hypothetical protein
LAQADEIVGTSKRIAKAYEACGQLSSAILEYESILELRPDDPDVKSALAEIVNRADSVGGRSMVPETDFMNKPRPDLAKGGPAKTPKAPEADDGREEMRKVFVTDGKYLAPSDFDQYWVVANLKANPNQVAEPFIQALADRAVLPLDMSLKLLCDKTRLCYLPLERYDLDIELARSFPREACQQWCVLPFDRMSKSVLVATANPYNRQAATDLKGGKELRFVWYLTSPADLKKLIAKVFRL